VRLLEAHGGQTDFTLPRNRRQELLPAGYPNGDPHATGYVLPALLRSGVQMAARHDEKGHRSRKRARVSAQRSVNCHLGLAGWSRIPHQAPAVAGQRVGGLPQCPILEARCFAGESQATGIIPFRVELSRRLSATRASGFAGPGDRNSGPPEPGTAGGWLGRTLRRLDQLVAFTSEVRPVSCAPSAAFPSTAAGYGSCSQRFAISSARSAMLRQCLISVG
jgi:hypothetical protein